MTFDADHPDDNRPPATRRAHAAGSMQFRTAPTGQSVTRALRAVTYVYLVLPLFVLAAGLDRPRVRSWPALWSTVVLGLLLAVSIARAHRQLRRARISAFVPSRAFVQVGAAVATFSLAGVALGLHGGTFLLLPVIAFAVLALFGNRAMIWRGWLVLVAALGVETAVQLPAYDALWSTLLFAATGAVLAAMIDEVVRGSVRALERNRQLAELATETSTLGDWPRDLVPLAGRLAAVMEVTRFAVFTHSPGRDSLQRALGWPDGDWPPWDEMSALAHESLERLSPVVSPTLVATPARAGTAHVVVVTPATSRLHMPIELPVLSSVAALLAAVLNRTRLISGLLEAANTDELTGLANRRRLFDVLQHEMARARRSGQPLSVAMMDLDYFKRYNDTFGHSAGDELLQRFAMRTGSRVRAQDLLSRYGGEEFCLVLPDTDLHGAMALVDGLRAKGAGQDRLGRRVTFSAGLATWDGAESAEELVFRADASLYRAKAAGRDRVAAAPAAS
jgi:diguanylate cyclase (GGDEF)-like protein